MNDVFNEPCDSSPTAPPIRKRSYRRLLIMLCVLASLSSLYYFVVPKDSPVVNEHQFPKPIPLAERKSFFVRGKEIPVTKRLDINFEVRVFKQETLILTGYGIRASIIDKLSGGTKSSEEDSKSWRRFTYKINRQEWPFPETSDRREVFLNEGKTQFLPSTWFIANGIEIKNKSGKGQILGVADPNINSYTINITNRSLVPEDFSFTLTIPLCDEPVDSGADPNNISAWFADRGLKIGVNAETISLSDTMARDEHLAKLKELPALTQLDLSNTLITAKGLSALNELPRLVRLTMPSSCDDSSLAAISNCQELLSLQLNNTQVTDQGLRYLQKLRKLETLTLRNTNITSEGVKYLESLSALRRLDLGYSQVDSGALPVIAAMPNLVSVSLIGTRITSSNLDRIGLMPSLKFLEITGNRLDTKALAQFSNSRIRLIPESGILASSLSKQTLTLVQYGRLAPPMPETLISYSKRNFVTEGPDGVVEPFNPLVVVPTYLELYPDSTETECRYSKPWARGQLSIQLLKQAALVTARHELGLEAIDSDLIRSAKLQGEPSPDISEETKKKVQSPYSDPLFFVPLVNGFGQAQILALQVNSQTHSIAWEHFFEVDPDNMIVGLTKRYEELSRSTFPELLKSQGSLAKTPPQRGDGEVPQSIRRLLDSGSEIGIFLGLSQLHNLVESEGESFDRLAALTRGYAELGKGMETGVITNHKLYKARALIYGNRLVSLYPDRTAYWYRAYALAFCGLRCEALKDIEAARQEEPKTDDPDGADIDNKNIPAWVPVIEAYCKHDVSALDALSKKRATRKLASYLHLTTLFGCSDGAMIQSSLDRAMKYSPQSFRAVEDALSLFGLGISRRQASLHIQPFHESVEKYLGETTALPDSLVTIIRDGRNITSLQDEFSWRRKLVDELYCTGRKTDALPLCALGDILDQQTFSLAWRLLSERIVFLAAPVDDLKEEIMPYFKGHRLERLLDVYELNSAVVAQKCDAIHPIVQSLDYDQSLLFILTDLRAAHNTRGKAGLLSNMHQSQDPVEWDLILQARFGNEVTWEPFSAIAELKRLAPETPLLLTSWVEKCAVSLTTRIFLNHEFPQWLYFTEDDVNRWVDIYSDNYHLMWSLSQYSIKSGDRDQAVICLKKCWEKTRQLSAAIELASTYASLSQPDNQIRIYEEVVDSGVRSLQVSYVQSQLCKLYLKRGDKDRAKEVALRAAQSFSGTALLAAAEICDETGDLELASKLYQANAERYYGRAQEWFFWSFLRDYQDRKLAEKSLQSYLDNAGPYIPDENKINLSVSLLLMDKPDSARKLIESLPKPFRINAYQACLEILLAYEFDGQGAARQKLQEMTSNLQRGKAELMSRIDICQILDLWREFLIDKKGMVAVDQIVEQLKSRPPEDGEMTNVAYFHGKFLDLSVGSETARPWMEVAASSPYKQKLTSALAIDWLRKKRFPVPPRRQVEKDYEPFDELIKKLSVSTSKT